MSVFITKVFLHLLFRLLFWSMLAVWLIVNGIFNTGWIRWINYILAIISFGSVIDNLVEFVAYFRKNEHK